MLSPTKATISSGGRPAGVVPRATASKRGFLSLGPASGLHSIDVVGERVRPEDRLGVRALGGGAVGDDRDPPAERADAGEKRGGARERDRLATGAPGRPARGVEGQAGPRALELVERVVEHGLVGVEDDGPGAGERASPPRARRGRWPRGRPAGRARGARRSRASSGSPRGRGTPPGPARGGDGAEGGLRRHGGGRAAAGAADGEGRGRGGQREVIGIAPGRPTSRVRSHGSVTPSAG